jgi:hypothetical protein
MKESLIPPERWIENLLDSAELIADQTGQESRWLAPDAFAWESPDEAINVLDDCALDRFIEQFSDSFSAEQAKAATEFRDEVDEYCKATPQHLDPEMVLADPRWLVVRDRASAFLDAFRNRWPIALK